MRRLCLIALLALALAAPLAAQQAQQPPPPPSQPATAPPSQQQQPPPSRGGVGRSTQPGQPPTPTTMPAGQRGRGGVPPPGGVTRREPTTQNIRIEVAITDSAEKTTRKVVTMLFRDRESGRIRSADPNGGVLNVDGFGDVVSEDRIAVGLTVEYQPQRGANMTLINQSITVLVAPGKPTIISQSADPNTDRKVAVEVTATIVK
jgi:hypothetical protein